jgi:hypothetical protein
MSKSLEHALLLLEKADEDLLTIRELIKVPGARRRLWAFMLNRRWKSPSRRFLQAVQFDLLGRSMLDVRCPLATEKPSPGEAGTPDPRNPCLGIPQG